MSTAVTFSVAVFALDTIKKAAYRFSDVFSAEIVPAADQTKCVLHFDPSVSEDQREQLVRAFRTEVLDQDLRARVAAETSSVRNAILGYAFSRTGLLGGGQ